MGETVTAIEPTAGSFDDLYRDRWLSMLRLGVFLLGDVPLAEDVVQDAFAALYRRWPSMRDSSGAAAYLRVSVVNGARSALRKRRTRNSTTLPPAIATDAADSGVLLAEEHREVLSALGTLPTRQREVTVLRYWGELSEREIAQTLGISAGTVKSSASRALAALSTALERNDEH